jgi:Flp pilus assembly secretin CpaC
MRFAALICCLLASPAVAEQLERPMPEADISVGLGRVQVLRLDSAIDAISVLSPEVLEAMPSTDHAVRLKGLQEGETILTVSKDGKEIYAAKVTVTAGPSHVVRIYGNRRSVPIMSDTTAMTDAAAGPTWI